LERRRNQSVHTWIRNVADHAALESEGLDPRPECSLTDLTGNKEKGTGKVDDGRPKHVVRGQSALIRVGPKCVDAWGLLNRLEQPQCCSIAMWMEQSAPGRDEGEGGFTAGRCVVEAVEVDLARIHPRVDRFGSPNPPEIRCLDRRELDAADEPDHVGLAHAARDHAGKVARLLEAE